MRLPKPLTVLVLAMAAVALHPSPAFAVPLAGRVVMGTAGAPFPGGLRLTVVEISAAGDLQQPVFVPIAEDGSYSFEGGPALEYLIGTIYREVTYSMVAEPGDLPARELKIHETTRDVSVVKISSDSMTVVPREDRPDELEILELTTYLNSSDRTYIGEEGEGQPVVRLAVPEGVVELTPMDEANSAGLAVGPRGLGSIVPLKPGEAQIPYLYRAKVPRSGWQLRREVLYPTEHVDLLVNTDLTLDAAPGFTFAEEVTLADRRYRRYRMESTTPGEVVAADIGFNSAGGSGSGVWVGFGTIVALVAAALGAATLRRRKRRLLAPGPGRAGAGRAELIEEVARLDERFDAGGVERLEYDRRRSELISALKSLSGPEE
ncbi:MAG: hypothetical protein ACT4OM_10785 [Actinomycetota bacterium]